MKYILLDFVSYAFLAAAIGTIIFTFRGKIKFLYGVIATAGALLLSNVVGIYSSNLQSGVNIITEQINTVFVMLKETLSSIPQEQMQMFGALRVENLDLIKDLYTVIFPSILILNTLTLSYIVYMVIKQIIGLFKKDVTMYPKFSELKLRRSATVALGVTYILPFFVWSNMVSAAITNLTIIISGAAIACGLSFIDFRLRQKLKNAWFRLLVYIAAFFVTSIAMPFVVFVLVFVAIADSFFDFRGLLRQEVKRDGQ
jgi:hypothetical protein